jgi:hypothetical protein
VAQREHYVKMAGRDVFRFATRVVPESVLQALEAARLTTDDIDLLIPHQANVRIIDSAARRLKLDQSSVFANVERYGNTSAASIPVALCEAVDAGLVQPGATRLRRRAQLGYRRLEMARLRRVPGSGFRVGARLRTRDETRQPGYEEQKRDGNRGEGSDEDGGGPNVFGAFNQRVIAGRHQVAHRFESGVHRLDHQDEADGQHEQRELGEAQAQHQAKTQRGGRGQDMDQEVRLRAQQAGQALEGVAKRAGSARETAARRGGRRTFGGALTAVRFDECGAFGGRGAQRTLARGFASG